MGVRLVVYYVKSKYFHDYDISKMLFGFKHKGYELICLDGVEEVAVDESTIFVGGVVHTHLFLHKNGIERPEFKDYPNVLENHYGRYIGESILGNQSSWYGLTMFIKPKHKGIFDPFIAKLPIWLRVAHIDDSTEIYLQTPIEIKAEFRAFVLSGKLLDIRQYAGDYLPLVNKLDMSVVNEVLSLLKIESPSYCVDFGLMKEKGKKSLRTIVVELNSGYSFGSYGLKANLYVDMIASTWSYWLSLVAKQKKTKES